MSNSLQDHGLQHTRLPCPSPTPKACLNSCPLSQWICPTVSSSVIPFSSCLQYFPASGSFPMSGLLIRWPKSWCLNHKIVLISHDCKSMLKILQTRLQQYVNWEIPDVKVGFKKRRGTRNLIANIHWIIEKAREFQKNIYFSLINYHQSLWLCVNFKEILEEMEIPDYLNCLLRNLHAGQEATVRTGHGTTDWFKVGKGVQQGCILSPCLFNLYAEYTMRNARLDESQTRIKIERGNINNLRYVDDTTILAEMKRN